MSSLLRFPTELHRHMAEMSRNFFAAQGPVDTVLVVNSCARGRAVPGSDLDLAVLVHPSTSRQEVQDLEARWQEFKAMQPLVREFRRAGRFAQVHLDVFDGRFAPAVWDGGEGPDSFEIEIGNRVAHAVPLYESGPHFEQLQNQWLPYYADELRLRRLAMVRAACAYDLDTIPFFLRRSLCFQAFDPLYKAFQEFLQALFIARRIYPIAYNKWIREQVADWLALPDLYRHLPSILTLHNLESSELEQRAEALRELLERWIQP